MGLPAMDFSPTADILYFYIMPRTHLQTLAIKEMKNKATGGKVSSSGH
jgi:hypothetical protein